MRTPMSSRQRILSALRHEQPDRVPVSPRVHAWLYSECGDDSLAAQLKALPEMDHMYFVPSPTPSYLDSYPEEYDLPEVRVEQRKYSDGNFIVVERIFHTPDGDLSDRTRIPPSGREYGVLPNPVKTEHLVKSPSDLSALRCILPAIRTDFSALRKSQEYLGNRGVILAWIHSAGTTRSSPIDMKSTMTTTTTESSVPPWI